MSGKTIVVCAFLWVALVMGADYALTGMNNDAVDEQFGTVAGLGFGGIVAYGIYSARSRKA